MKNQFKSTNNWANSEIAKKMKLYSYAWIQTLASKVYISAWVEAK